MILSGWNSFTIRRVICRNSSFVIGAYQSGVC